MFGFNQIIDSREQGCAEGPVFVFVSIFVEAAKLFILYLMKEVPTSGLKLESLRSQMTALTAELKLYSLPHYRQTSTYLYTHNTETALLAMCREELQGQLLPCTFHLLPYLLQPNLSPLHTCKKLSFISGKKHPQLWK